MTRYAILTITYAARRIAGAISARIA